MAVRQPAEGLIVSCVGGFPGWQLSCPLSVEKRFLLKKEAKTFADVVMHG
jgi:hypothetical protein